MAGYDQLQIHRARFGIESSFGGDLTGDVATNLFDLRHEAIDFMPADLTVPDPTVVQRDFQRYNDVRGPKRATAALTSPWSGTGQALDAVTAPVKTAQSKMLEALLGGYHAGQGSTIEASPAPTTTGAAVADASGFEEGSFAAVVINGTAVPVLITEVSGDDVTWWPALPSAPAAGATLYNAQSIFLTGQPTSTIQMLWEAAKQRGNIWLAKGGQGDFSLDLTRNQIAKWSSTLSFNDYAHDDEILTPQGGGPISVASYDGTGPCVAFRGGVHFGPTNSTTRTLVNAADITIGFGRAWLEQGLHSGLEGVDAPQLDTRGELTCEITLRVPDPWEAYHEAYEAETDFGMLLWLDGGGASKGRCVAVPTMSIRRPPEPAEAFGLRGVKLTMLVKESTLASDQSTEIRRSPVALGHY